MNVKRKKNPLFPPALPPYSSLMLNSLIIRPYWANPPSGTCEILGSLVHDRLALPMDKEVELQAMMMPMARRTYPETRSHFSMALFLWGWKGI